MNLLSVQQIADRLSLSVQTVRRTGKHLELGVNYGGRAGWRYTEAEAQRIAEYLHKVATERAERAAS